jgi:hypothetical protein
MNMKRLFNYLGKYEIRNYVILKYEIKCIPCQKALYSYAGILPAVVKSVLNIFLQYMVLKSTDQQGKGKGTQLFMSTFIFHKRVQQKIAELMPLATGPTKTLLQDSFLLN